MFVTPTRHQYTDPSPPFDDHRYFNVEGKVKLFRRSAARKNLFNMYYQNPAFGQQPPEHAQAATSSFREPKVSFRMSCARKNLLNIYHQTPVFGQQPPGHGQASSSSFREPKVNFRRSGARKIYLICIIRPLCLVNSHLGMGKLHHHHLEFGKMLKNPRYRPTSRIKCLESITPCPTKAPK